MILRRDDAFIAVCEILTPISVTSVKIGTGMFVSSPTGNGDEVFAWIVTASHVAKVTNEKTIIVIATKDGKAKELPLTTFGPITNWRHHAIADISVFKIIPEPTNVQFLKGRFLPIDHFNLEHNSVSRDYELTAIGFPNGMGTSGSFSPFTFRSYASSSFVTLNRADTKTPSEFFCLESPSVGGYSGGPVLDLGYSTDGIMTTTKEKTICHGIMHGTISDETGGKIAAVTPAFYLRDVIDGSY